MARRPAKEIAETKVARTLLLAAVFALTIIGLVMVYSASSASLAAAGKSPYTDVIMQAIYVAIGGVIAVWIWQFVPYELWADQFTVIFWGLCMVLLVMTFAFGKTINGAKRWLQLGPISLQPSEFIKVALLLMTIRLMYRYRQGQIDFKKLLQDLFILVGLPLVFMYFTQSDMGTALICAIGILAALWIGGFRGWMLAALIGIGLFMLVAGTLGTGYRANRFVYLDPWNDGQGGLGSGNNIIRSYYALAEGGLFGVGIGNSHEKYQYLFASESDFIFAVLGEELGLAGALIVIGLFVLFLFAALRISVSAPDNLGSMISGACAIMLVFQAFLNIGCAIGVFPTTGKPLPFISSGGTSVISSFIIVGLILAVEHATAPSKNKVFDKARQNLKLVR